MKSIEELFKSRLPDGRPALVRTPVWRGILTDGEPVSLNGGPFTRDPDERDAKKMFTVGDEIGYASGRIFMITEVESDLVEMTGPINYV